MLAHAQTILYTKLTKLDHVRVPKDLKFVGFMQYDGAAVLMFLLYIQMCEARLSCIVIY